MDSFKENDLEIIKSYDVKSFIQSNYFKDLKNILANNQDICCYFDCDGVLFNTIEISFREMGLDYKIEIKDEKIQAGISEYYRNVDWYELLSRSEEINNGCESLLVLKKLNLFKYIAIATHRHTYFNEAMAKKRIFNERANGITVLDIPFKLKKNFALKAFNNILVDDSKKKILEWVASDGIGVLFDKDFKGLEFPTEERPYFIINNILDLTKVMYFLKIYKKEKVLKKIK